MNFLMSSDDNQKYFDYSLLSPELSEKLQSYDKQLNRIHQDYSIEVGEVLYNAQQEFSNPKDGNFIKWVEYKGFKSSNAYNYINIYKAFQSLESISDKETFLEQSKSLQIEMSKPSANPEINQAVFNGDITTHKEYKEREKEFKKQLKQQAESHQRQLAEKDEVINKTYEKLRKEQQREPQVVEKAPDDYQELKREALNSRVYLNELNRMKQNYSLLETKYSLLESSTAEAKEIERKLKGMRAEEKSILDKMQAVDDFVELEAEFNQFFDTKMAPMRFKGIANYLYATNAIERIKAMINQADLWVEEMNKLIPNSNIKIIEGEFTDE